MTFLVIPEKSLKVESSLNEPSHICGIADESEHEHEWIQALHSSNKPMKVIFHTSSLISSFRQQKRQF